MVIMVFFPISNLIFVHLFSLPPAPNAPLLHLLSGSGAGPGAEHWTAAGHHHPAHPDLHPGKLH